MPRERYIGPPMDVGNMRANGVRALNVQCFACLHSAILNIDHVADGVTINVFRPRMVCTNCGIVGYVDVRQNWIEAPKRESLTGQQWRGTS